MAWDFRQSGKTYREIGKRFGVSSTRARQLVISHQERIDTTSKNIFIIELQKMDASCSTRILNALKDRFENVERIDPKLIASIGHKKLCKTKNIGLKSANYIALALENLGVIKDATEWKTKT